MILRKVQKAERLGNKRINLTEKEELVLESFSTAIRTYRREKRSYGVTISNNSNLQLVSSSLQQQQQQQAPTVQMAEGITSFTPEQVRSCWLKFLRLIVQAVVPNMSSTTLYANIEMSIPVNPEKIQPYYAYEYCIMVISQLISQTFFCGMITYI